MSFMNYLNKPKPPHPERGGPGGAFYGAPGRTMGSYNAQNAGSNGAAPGWATDTIKNRYVDSLNRSGSQAEMAEDEFLQRARGFDARSYTNDVARGAFNQFLPELERNIGELRGQQVGMGRLNTGFATEDEDRLVTQMGQGLNNTLSQAAMQAAGLDLNNTQMIGNYGMEQGNRYLQGVAGQYDMKTAETNERKGRTWGHLGGAAKIAGSFL